MTDMPRFKPVRRGPEDAFRDYHGAPLVDLVFRIADAFPRRASASQSRGFRHVAMARRELIRPLGGLARVRTGMIAGMALGLVVWAVAATVVPGTGPTTPTLAQGRP